MAARAERFAPKSGAGGFAGKLPFHFRSGTAAFLFFHGVAAKSNREPTGVIVLATTRRLLRRRKTKITSARIGSTAPFREPINVLTERGIRLEVRMQAATTVEKIRECKRHEAAEAPKIRTFAKTKRQGCSTPVHLLAFRGRAQAILCGVLSEEAAKALGSKRAVHDARSERALAEQVVGKWANRTTAPISFMRCSYIVLLVLLLRCSVWLASFPAIVSGTSRS